MDDQSRLTEALAEYLTEFGQRHWYVNERYWERAQLAFIHAKKKTRTGGIHEAMVMARLVEGRIRLRRYVLLASEEEWLACDQEAFEGFLEDGPRGLKRGHTRTKRTICSCGFRVHRSGVRASRYARDLARRYGKSGIQRSYRCDENPRAFHLTSQQKGSRKPIPDAYIDPGVDWFR